MLSRIRKASEYGRLPVNVAVALEETYENYRNAVSIGLFLAAASFKMLMG